MKKISVLMLCLFALSCLQAYAGVGPGKPRPMQAARRAPMKRLSVPVPPKKGPAPSSRAVKAELALMEHYTKPMIPVEVMRQLQQASAISRKEIKAELATKSHDAKPTISTSVQISMSLDDRWAKGEIWQEEFLSDFQQASSTVAQEFIIRALRVEGFNFAEILLTLRHDDLAMNFLFRDYVADRVKFKDLEYNSYFNTLNLLLKYREGSKFLGIVDLDADWVRSVFKAGYENMDKNVLVPSIEMLKEHHIDINAVDVTGGTVLHYIVKWYWSRDIDVEVTVDSDLYQATRMLVTMGADPSIKRTVLTPAVTPTELLASHLELLPETMREKADSRMKMFLSAIGE